MYKRACTLLILLAALLQTACGPLDAPAPTYAEFLETHRADYPACMDVYMDRELMAKATPKSPIHICLEQ